LKAIYLPVNSALAETIYVEMHQDEMDRSFVDMVNLLYVALTRPEERLFILTDEISDKTDGAKSIGKLLSAFLISEGVFAPNKDIYEFGSPWKKSIRKTEPVDHKQHVPNFTPRSNLQMRLRYHALQFWDLSDPEKNREWGKFVHAVMARIKHSGDLDKVLHDMLTQGEINPGQYNDLYEMTRKILSHPQISRFFEPPGEIKNEPEIVSADGTIHRPDRLLISQDEVTIIDYKTGRPAKDHQDQLNTYAQLLRDMNYKVTHAYLLYLNKEPEVVQVI